MNGHVTFGQSKALWELGYRGEWPQLVWVAWKEWTGAIGGPGLMLYGETDAEESGDTWYPAPDYLTALDFMATLGLFWERSHSHGWGAGCFLSDLGHLMCDLEADTPSELLDAMLADHQEHTDVSD